MLCALLFSLSLCICVYNREYSEAQRLYEEALRLVPNSSIAHTGLGYIAHISGDLDGAIESYHKVWWPV